MNNSPSIFAKRLNQARKMRGWSLAALREAMRDPVSIAALSKYEKGQSMPSSGVLVSLSEALDVPMDYLFREFEVTLDRVRFRKMSRLPKRDQNAIAEQSRDFFERYYQIEELVGATVKYEYPLRSSISETANPIEMAEAMAEELRRVWKIGQDPIPNIHALLEENGIKVHFIDGCSTDFDGFSADTERGPVVVVSKKLTAARKRMTALHELAHLLCKPLKLDEKEEEKFVHPFTSALLLPKDAIRSTLGTTRGNLAIGELLEIKKRYGIAMSAVMMRARDTGIISADQVMRFFRFGPGGKWRSAKREPFDKELGTLFPEANTRYNQLVFRAYGEELITLSQAAGYLDKSVDEANQMLNAPVEL